MGRKTDIMNEEKQENRVWLLFINIFSISMTANSGYAMLGVLKNRFVDKYGWFTKEEMEDYIALAQSSPGPIAVNSSVLIGYQAAGPAGAFAAVMGVIIPPFIMMVIVSLFYSFISTDPYVRIFINGMQAGVVAMLIDVMIGLFQGVAKRKNILYYIIMVISFLFVRLTDYSIFFLAMGCILTAIIKTYITTKEVR